MACLSVGDFKSKWMASGCRELEATWRPELINQHAGSDIVARSNAGQRPIKQT